MSASEPRLRSSDAVGPLARHLPRILAATFVLFAAAQLGCITREVRQVIKDDGHSQLILREEKKGSKTIDQGFTHPSAIAPVRLAHILSRIDMRTGKGQDMQRVAAVPLDTLFDIAEMMAEGLETANSSQEVAIQSVRRDKHWALFDRYYLTSLLTYARGDTLYIHISRSDWEIPKRQRAEVNKSRLPETHVGNYPLDFRLIAEYGMTLVDHQSVAVDWKNDVFRKPTRTRITSTGKVVRRTVLMESMEDETDYGDQPRMPDDITPEQLRDLADLEERRREGSVSEAEYSATKIKILTGEQPAP